MRVSQNGLEIKRLQDENQRLLLEEPRLLENQIQHRRVLSPFRRLPDDIVREILVACMDPTVVSIIDSGTAPLVFTLISSNFRQVALTTPQLWDSLHIEFNRYLPHLRKGGTPPHMRRYSQLVREWLIRRSGAMPLRILIKVNCVFRGEYGLCDGLVDDITDTILACASRWKDIEFITPPFSKISRLKATDVPSLCSLTLHNKNSVLLPSMAFLRAPKLSRLIICLDRTSPGNFSIKWHNITQLSLDGTLWRSNGSLPEIVHILRQTVNLVMCSLRMRCAITESIDPMTSISLPFLKSLKLELKQTAIPQIMQYIHAPIIETLHLSNYAAPLEIFFDRSPHLRALYVGEASLPPLIAALRFCPSLKTLHILHTGTEISQDHEAFLGAFVGENTTTKICPRLEYFVCFQTLDISTKTARAFIERRDTEVPSVICWKGIAISAVKAKTHRYIADTIAENGLNEVDEWN